MNTFTALRKLTPLHFTFIHSSHLPFSSLYFNFLINPHFPSLHIYFLHFATLVITFLTLSETMRITGESPYRPLW
jgi:hypothetical protein